LFLEVIHVALVVIDRGDLLRHQIKGEVGKKEAFHESQDAPDERVRVVPVVHMNPRILARQQVIEGHDAE